MHFTPGFSKPVKINFLSRQIRYSTLHIKKHPCRIITAFELPAGTRDREGEKIVIAFRVATSLETR